MLTPQERAAMDKVVASPAAKKPGALDKVIGTAKAVVKSEIKGFKDFGSGVARMADNPVAAGQDLATPIVTQLPSVKAARSQAEAAAQQEQAARAALITKRNQVQAVGGDTSALNSVITNNTPAIPLSGTLNDAENKTRLQVAGDFAGTAADVLSAGQIGAEGNLASQVAKGAATGYGFDVSQNLKDGATGVGIAKPGMGTVIGAGVPLIQPAISAAGKGISSAVSKAKEVATAVPTPKELSVGSKAFNDTWDLVKPDIKPSAVGKATIEGRVIRKGILGTTTQIPKGKDVEIVRAAHEYISGVSDPTVAIEKLKGGIATEADTLRQGLKDSGAIWNRNDLKGALHEVEKPDLLVADKTLNGAYDLMKKRILGIAEKAPKTLDGLLDVRQELDKAVERQYPNLYSSPTLTPMKQAILDLRSAINQQIENQLPEGLAANGVHFRDSLRKQSLLFDAYKNASGKVGAIGDNALTRFGKKYPNAKKVIGYSAGAAGAGVIGNSILN